MHSDARLCGLLLYTSFFVAAGLVACLAAGFIRSTVWGRILTKAIAILLALVGPFLFLNPFLVIDIRNAEVRSGVVPSSDIEFILFLAAYEIILFFIFLIDESSDGTKRPIAWRRLNGDVFLNNLYLPTLLR